jgi:hypothetical protein
MSTKHSAIWSDEHKAFVCNTCRVNPADVPVDVTAEYGTDLPAQWEDCQHPRRDWYVVVERSDLYTYEPMTPYVVGPYTEDEATEEIESDSGIAYCLLTIDAKAERYCADECYMTTMPPTGERIIYTPED